MNHINYFVDYKYPNMSNTSSGNIVDTEVGFKRGNMFNSLYDEYKNYKPYTPKLETPKDRLMYDIQMYGFGLNDLVLYLDLNPQDEFAGKEFDKLQNEFVRAVKKYEDMFGPINLTSSKLDNLPWKWVNKPYQGGMM